MAGRKESQDGEKSELEKGWCYWQETRTVVMQELFDEVYVSEDHTPAAVSLQLQLVKSIAREWVRQEKAKEATDAEIGGETNPSFMSFARSSR